MLDRRKIGVRYRLNVISHSITLELKMRDGLKRDGLKRCYKPEMRVSPWEYGKQYGLSWITDLSFITSSPIASSQHSFPKRSPPPLSLTASWSLPSCCLRHFNEFCTLLAWFQTISTYRTMSFNLQLILIASRVGQLNNCIEKEASFWQKTFGIDPLLWSFDTALYSGTMGTGLL